MQIKIVMKHKKDWKLILFLMLGVCVCILLLGRKQMQQAAKAADDTIVFDSDADFRILEIVPYRGMGEIGYLVKGEEPVDLKAMSLNQTRNHWNLAEGTMQKLFNMNSSTDALMYWDPSYHKTLTLKEGDSLGDYFRSITKCDEFPEDTITATGYFKRVQKEKGLYQKTDNVQIVEKGTGTYLPNVVCFEADTDGDYNLSFLCESDQWYESSKVNADWGMYGVKQAVKVTNGTGDYTRVTRSDNFDYYTWTPGAGNYDVTFQRIYWAESGKAYYIQKDYEIAIGTGSYQVKTTWRGNGNYYPAENGDYNPVFEPNLNGDYIWVDGTKDSYHSSGLGADEVGYTEFYESYTRGLAYFYRGEYINPDAFKKWVLRLPEDTWEDYQVDVLTVTPREVNANPDLVKQADFIYIFPKCHNSWYVDNYGKYGWNVSEEPIVYTSGMVLPDFYGTYLDGAKTKKVQNDLSWECVYTIAERVVKDQIAVFFDGTIYSSYHNYWKDPVEKKDGTMGGAGTCNNIAKLYLMLMQMLPEDFYHQYLAADATRTDRVDIAGYSDASRTLSTGYYHSPNGKLDTAIYWNQETFLPSWPTGYSNHQYLELLKKEKIVNPWVTGGNALLSAHTTIASGNGSYGINANLFMDWIVHDEDGVWTNLEVMEYIQERDGLTTTPEKADGKDVLNYIIHKRIYRNQFIKKELTILDLEPCMDQTLTKEDVRRWTNNQIEESKITIVPISTAEFNGKSVDLTSTYDLIYCGLGTATMNVEDGHTVYNQESLNGKIYLHIGDVVKAGPKLGGMFADDYQWDWLLMGMAIKGYSYLDVLTEPYQYQVGNFRYSGNDITSLKQQELSDYIDHGYPLIVADGFFTEDESAMNDAAIDNSSYIYELVNDNRPSSVMNVLRNQSVTAEKLSHLLNVQEVQLIPTGTAEAGTWPQEYSCVDGTIDETSYLKKRNGRNLLNYEFQLRGLEGVQDISDYNITLYLDLDGDGEYDSEEITDTIVTKEGQRQLPADGIYHLSLDTTYHLTAEVDKTYNGILPYRLEVRQNVSSKAATASYEGYVAIHTEAKEKIKVLQIVSSDYHRATSSSMNADQYANAYQYLDLSVVGEENFSGNLLYPYLSALKDYEFEFVTITVSEFEALYETDINQFNMYWRNKEELLASIKYTPKKVGRSYSATYEECDGTMETSRIEAFDLIVFGFGNELDDINLESAGKDIDYYLSTNRGMIVSHDTLSFIQAEESHYVRTEQVKFDYQLVGCFDLCDKYWGYEFAHRYRNLLGMDRYGASDSWDDSIDLTKKDKAYTAGSDRGETEKEIHGFTYGILNSNAVAISSVHTGHQTYLKYSNLNCIDISSQLPEYMYEYQELDLSSNRITRVNEGAITRYPYTISNDIGISTSHSGYYQLDLEVDKNQNTESDLKVWYCLSDDKAGRGMYSASHNDVTNNYYLYTKGNLTVTGLGHSKLTSEDEAKLFVNTLIASYHEYTHSNDTVDIKVRDEIKLSDTEYYVYVDADVNQQYDPLKVSEPTDERYYEKIAFEITCDIEKEVSAAVVNDSGDMLNIYGYDQSVMTGNLHTNTRYYLYVKKADVNHKFVKLKITCEDKTVNIIVLRRNLFHLD